MNRAPSEPQPEPSADAAGERIICVVARDVLALQRQPGDSNPFLECAWRGRWLILAFVVGCALLAAVFAFVSTPWYTAEVVLAPAGSKNTRGLSGQLESLGLLEGLAGEALGGARTAEPIGVLKSRDFARQFIEEQRLLHVLLADNWDERSGRWKETDPHRQPDIRDAIDYFDKHILLVTEDKKTGLFRVDVQWKDPTTAASWANRIVELLNDQMRTRALAEDQANVDYLQKELAESSVVEVKQAIAKLLETELQKVMVARGDRQYAFRVVDHADVPKRRSWPRRRVIVAVGILAGGLAGFAAVFLRELARKSRRAV